MNEELIKNFLPKSVLKHGLRYIIIFIATHQQAIIVFD